MNMQLGRIITVSAFAVLAGGALAQPTNSAGGTQNTGGTGQPGTTNSGNPTNMAPTGTPAGAVYKNETEYKGALSSCDSQSPADQAKCRSDVDRNWNSSRSGSNMGRSSGAMKDSAQGSATAQNKCAELTGTKKEECLKTTNAGGGGGTQ